MLITRRSLIRRLLDDNARARARTVRRYLLKGQRANWRAIVAAEDLPAADLARIQRTLLEMIDGDAAARIIRRLDRYTPGWHPFIAALAGRHGRALEPVFFELLRDRRAARVAIGVIGLGELAEANPEAGAAVRGLIVTGEPVNDQGTVTEAILVLGRMGDEASIDLLAQLCRSPEPWRRRTAARALAEVGRPAAVRALLPFAADPDLVTPAIASLLTTQVDVARMIAARDSHLARVGLVVFRALVAGLGAEVDLALLPRLRMVEQVRAVVALFAAEPRLPVIQAVIDLTDALHQRWWPALREPAQGSGTGVVKPPLANDRPAAAARAGALAQINALVDEHAALDKPAVAAGLIEGLDDPDEEYVRGSVVCLGRLGAESAVQPLVKLLPTVWGPLRRQVVETLGLIGSQEAASPLLEALRARLDERSLGDLEHTDVERQEIAALFQALCRLRGDVPLWVYRSALEEADETTRRVAAESLGHLVENRDRDAIDLLVTLLKNERSAPARAAAARGLGHPSVGHAADALVEALERESDVDVQRAIIRALGFTRALRATSSIQRLFREAHLQRESALALGRIAPARLPHGVIHVLVQMATDPGDVEHAVEAIQVLGRYDVYEAQIALEHLARDPKTDPIIREAAEHARWNRAHL